MANVKKITDLPIAESTEGLNLIVNDNGAAKQIAADKVGRVKSVNGAAPDENGNVEIDSGIKVASTAKVGQTIVVKSVDVNGNPIEWECVDMASGGGLNEAQIIALDEMFKIAAYTADATTAYEAFKVAFGLSGDNSSGENGETVVTLTSITATYSGGDVAKGTALTDLTGITVTANYSNGSTANITDYTLSGEIAEGSNIITVSYGGLTTTFTVIGIVAVVTSLRGVQLPIVPHDFKTNENWQYSANSGNLATAIGSARYLYLGRVFTGTVYLRNVCHTPFAGNTAYMHLVAEDYITNQTDVSERLNATEEIKQFDGKYLRVAVSDGSYEFRSDYPTENGYGYVRVQKFDIPEGKYAVISAPNGGETVNNTKNVDGWFTAFFENPIDNITITEVHE